MGPYQGLSLWAGVDLVAMEINEYSTFLKASVLLEPHHCLVSYAERSFRDYYHFAEMQSAYSATQVDRATILLFANNK